MGQPKKSRKGNRKTWILFIFAAAILFIFRKSVFLAVVKIALSFSLSGKNSSFTYSKMHWDNDVIRISDVHFVNKDAELLIQEADLALSGTLFSWKVHATVFHPQINVKPSSPSHSAPLHFLFAPYFSKISWEIYDGVVRLDDNPPLYFSFLPDERLLGKIALSYEPQSQTLPLFTALLEEIEGILKIDFSLIEEDCSRLMPIALALFPQFPKEWERTQGKVEASGTLHMDPEGSLTELSCQWKIDSLALESQSSGIELIADELSGAFCSDTMMPLDLLWQKGKGQMQCKSAKLQFGTPYCFHLEYAEIVLVPDQEPYLHLAGACQYAGSTLPFVLHAKGELHNDASFLIGIEAAAGGQDGNVQLEGSICRFEEKKYVIDLHFKDLLFEHFAFFAPHFSFPWPKECWVQGALDGSAVLLYENDQVQIDTEITFGEEKWVAGALFDPALHLQEGWFETEKATERTYGPFLTFFYPDCRFTGEVQLKGNFDPSYLVLSMQVSDAALHHGSFDLLLPAFGESGAEIIYDMKEKTLKGEIPLSNAKCSGADLTVDSLNALIHLDGHTLDIPSFSAVYNEIPMQGSVGSLTFNRTSQKLQIEKAKTEWSLKDKTTLALYLPSCDIDFAQDLNSNFHLLFKRDQKRVLELAGSAQRSAQMNWDIALDRQKTRFLDTPLNVSGLHVSKDRRIAVDLHPVLSCDELLSHLTWLCEAGIFSFPLESLKEMPCQGTLQMSFSSPDLNSRFRFKIESKDMAYKNKKIAPVRLSGQYLKGERIEIEECTGENFSFKAHCALLENTLHLNDVEGQVKGIVLNAAAEIDLLTRAFCVSLDSVKGNTSIFAFSDQINGSFAAHGNLQGSLTSAFRISGDAVCTFDLVKPFGIAAWNVKPLKISYAYDSGLCIDELSAYLKSKKEGMVLGLISCDQCRITSLFDACDMQAIRCSVDPLLLKECADAELLPSILSSIVCPGKLEASGDLQIGREGWTCKAALKEGVYGIKDLSLGLQKIGLQCQRGVFTLQAKTTVGEQPLWGALSVALTKNPQAILRITDDPQAEGIRMQFRCIGDQLHWEKIQGSCLGLDCALAKTQKSKYPDASVLTGRIGIDASRIPSLFSPAIAEKWGTFKPGKGYSWKGDLILWKEMRRGFQMTGEIAGDDWELLGYRFKSLRAELDAYPTRIQLSNIHVEDDAGTIAIKKIDIEKKEHWELSIPLVSVREWHPSSMKKIDALASPLKPFLIRNFTLSCIHADLEKAESLEGRGKLTFTNAVKKESTLLDTPIEMIKNFGLDPGLLTPVQGEIDFDLRGEKMYLVTIKDAFSEGRRSEFYLSPERDLSYIDLDGKMHIDLKMRQDVTLKLTEPFTLTIRGTLENPRYGLDLLP